MSQAELLRGSTQRLHANALTTREIISASLANVAPAMSFFFSFGLIVAGAGLASPLTLVVAAIAMLFHANTIAEFTKSMPSTGSYVSFIGKTFGGALGIITALTIAFGYILAIGSVMVMLGNWTAVILEKFLNIYIPWQIITFGFVVLVGYLVISGVKLSTKWAVRVFLFELLLLLISAFAMIVGNAKDISFASFNPLNMSHGLTGLGLGFPIAVFMFIGVGNSAPMAEETENPRKSVPKAIYSTVLLAAVLYIFMAWATTIGFHNDVNAMAQSPVPFVAAGSAVLGSFSILVYLAGFTSTFASMIGATNGQTRMIFSAAREGLLPSVLSKVSKKKTPWAAITFYLTVGLFITLVWGSIVGPVNLFDYLGTFGGIPITLTYIVVNFALPVYYWRHHRDSFSWLRHFITPILGILTLILPMWGLIQPGQTSPYNVFPGIVFGYLVIAIVYGIWLNAKKPHLKDLVGSIIADQHE